MVAFDVADITAPPIDEIKAEKSNILVKYMLDALENARYTPESLEATATAIGVKAYSSWHKQMGERKDRMYKISPSDQKCLRESCLKRVGIKPDYQDNAKAGTFCAGDIGEDFLRGLAILGEAPLVDSNVTLRIPLVDTQEDPPTVGEIRAETKRASDGEIDYADSEILTSWTLGECDDLLQEPGMGLFVTDMKTMTQWNFNAFAKGTYEDGWGYHSQLKVYSLSPDLPEDPVGLLLAALNKNTWRHIAENRIALPDEAFRQWWYNRCKIVLASNAALLPPRPNFATVTKRPRLKVLEVDDFKCNYCDRVVTCFADLGDFKETSPKKWRASC